VTAAVRWALERVADGALIVQSLRVADRAWTRLAGLQFKRNLPPGNGLLLVPCGSAHTLFMRFPIAMVAIDRSGTVVDVRRRVPPWRPLVLPRGKPFGILELCSGETGVEPGDQLRLREATDSTAPIPRSLRFLCP